MSQISPLDRIHKVYKSKINSHNLSSYAFHNKQKKIEELEQAADSEAGLGLESLEISPEKLKAKRDLTYSNNIMHTFTGDASKFLGDGQYRIRFSARSVEVDSY